MRQRTHDRLVVPRAPARLGAAAVALAAVLGTSVAVAPAAGAGAGADLKTKLHKLRVCESGDNYHENTGNGFYGAYQFSRSTWHGLGFHGRPDRAKPVRQDHAARELHHEAGWSAWPSCSRREHLR